MTDQPVEPTSADQPIVVLTALQRRSGRPARLRTPHEPWVLDRSEHTRRRIDPRPDSAEIGPCAACRRDAQLNARTGRCHKCWSDDHRIFHQTLLRGVKVGVPRLARGGAPEERVAGWSVPLRQQRWSLPRFTYRGEHRVAPPKVEGGPMRVLRVLPGRSRSLEHPWDSQAVSWWGLGGHDWNAKVPDHVWREQIVRSRWGVSAIRGTLQSDEARRHDARAQDPRLRLGGPVRRSARLHLRCLVCLQSLNSARPADDEDQVCSKCESAWRDAGRPWDEQYREFVTERRVETLRPFLREVLNERARNEREGRRAVWGRLAKLTPKELAAVLNEAQRRLHPLDHLAALDIAVACSLVRGESEETPCSEHASFADVVRFPHTDDGGGERDSASSF